MYRLNTIFRARATDIGVSMDSKFYVLALVVVVCETYIVPIGDEHECIKVNCENGGIIQNETCTCACGTGYSGVYCEIEHRQSHWPKDGFSIPTSLFGCPEDIESGWDHGYINITLPEQSPKHIWNTNSPIYSKPNILGPFYKHSIQLNFCVKRSEDNDTEKLNWEEGNYCILKSGKVCPKGFNIGEITIKGYIFESNDVGGNLPDVDISNSSITMRFCCRQDADTNKAVALPASFPFNLYLGPSTSDCQPVKNMVVQKDVFYMTDADNSWSFSGSIPLLDNTTYTQRIGIPFCYYTPEERRECYFESDGGNSYNGKMNISETGKSCLVWANVSTEFVNSRHWYGEFEKNYCRGYGDGGLRAEIKPACKVDMNGTEEYCNITTCGDNDPDMSTIGVNKPYYNIEGSDPEYAVDGLLSIGQSFVSKRPVTKPWFQIDLQEHVKVYAIQIARRALWFPVSVRYLGTYVSKYQWDFLNYGAFRCDNLRFPYKAKTFRFQCKRPITGQFVSLRDFDDMDPDKNVLRYYYFSLQEVTVFGKKTKCGRPLGMITGNIYSYQIDSSSVLLEGESKFISYKGRVLNHGIGWCSDAATDKQPWFSVDLITPRKIQGLLFQGWYDGQSAKLIKKFTISYGVRKNKLRYLEDPLGVRKVFRLDPAMPATSIQRIMFSNEIMARWIQINPMVEVGESACLKLEVIGCHQQVIRDLFCKPGSIDYGFATARYIAWWMEEPNIPPWYNYRIMRENECQNICLKNNCTSFYQSASTIEKSYCIIHKGHRFQPENYDWWLTNMVYGSVSSHRLCFKDIREINTCSRTISLQNDTKVKIESPGSPLMYEQGLDCTWDIIAEKDRYIKVEIIHVNMAETISSISLKENGIYEVNPGTCNDQLTITDKIFGKEAVIQNENENSYYESTFITASNKLSVNFTSCFQSSPQEQNYFQIDVTAIDFPGCGMVSKEFMVKCKLPTAYISNHRFPARYEEGESRVWSIEGSFGQYVEFEFISLDLIDADEICGKSHVAIYDTDLKGEETLIGRYCKTNRPYEKILSKWQTMRIEFRSGSSKTGRGFLGKYSFVNYTQINENSGNQDCEPGWSKGDNNCYKLFYADNNNDSMSDSLTWVASERRCVEQGAHLVSINSPHEMKTIHSLLTTVWDLKLHTNFYIGLQKKIEGAELSFSWTDGSPLTYTAWYKDPKTGISQPDGLTDERCTSISLYSIHTIEDWNDIACAYDKIQSYICEKKINTTLERNEVDLHHQLLNTNHMLKVDRSLVFNCNNSQYISKTFVCDGNNDCGDMSDEEKCDTTCAENQFKCNDNTCISVSLYCDFKSDCRDGSDETHCVRPICADEEWQCTNKQCIPLQHRCDLIAHCLDESDEIKCEQCDDQSFQCYDQRCIPKSLVCDGYVDCSGRFAEDESQDCQNNVQSSCTKWWSLGKRKNGEYMINMGRYDIASPVLVECEFKELNNAVYVKTRVHHRDEEKVDTRLKAINIDLKYGPSAAVDYLLSYLKKTASCTQSILLQCTGVNRIFDIHWIADNGEDIHMRSSTENCSCPFVNKCETGVSSCNCNSTYNTWRIRENNAKLEDSGIITNEALIPIRKIESPFVSLFQIEIGAFECTETLIVESSSFLCRSGVTIPDSIKCLLQYDKYGEVEGCRDLSHLDDCDTFVCPIGYVKCKNSFCIPIHLMCDGRPHCAHGEDEAFCANITCHGLFKCRGSNVCLKPDRLCNGVQDCPMADDEFLCSEQCPSNCTCNELSVQCHIIDSKSVNVSAISIDVRKLNFQSSNFENALPSLGNFSLLAELNLSHCKIKAIEAYYFQALNNLYLLDLSHNNIVILVSNTFAGLGNLKQLILHGNTDLLHIEPSSFMGLQTLPELTIQKTKLSHLFSNTFDGLDNIKSINLSENNIHSVENSAFIALASLKTLDISGNKIEIFSSQIFKGLSSLLKLKTDAYVFCCLKPPTVSSLNCLPQEDEFSSCADLMRKDVLRWFLWIIGICAFLGNLGVLIYRFAFDRQTLKKGHGVLIANLGVSDLCMGIYLLIIASADSHFRGRYIWNDIAWRQGGLCKFAGFMSTIASECSVVFLCLITIDRILAVKFPFGQYRFNQKRAIFAAVIAWSLMFFIAIAPLFPSSYFNDEFYSRSGVCLALPLTRDKPSGWEYGTTIFIVFNFVVFVVIALGQLLIYKEVAIAVDAKIRTQRRNQDMAVARSLFLVMFTDFICWFPIGVMGLMALSGQRIPGEVYAWTAVFILPVNSALNPFLYTFSAIIKGKSENGWKLSTKRNRRTSGSLTTNTEIGLTEIIQSDRFILGTRYDSFNTLADYMKTNVLSVADMTSITKYIMSGISFLHERGMVHGSFEEKDVVLEIIDGSLNNVMTKVSPKIAMENTELAEDMHAVGQLVRRMLRNQMKLTVSKSGPL